MSKRKRVNAMNEAHARRLCLQGRGPVYLDGVEYEFRLVPDGQSEDRVLEELRDAQASVPVEDQIERACGFKPSLALSGADHVVEGCPGVTLSGCERDEERNET